MPHDTPLVYLMERRPGEGPGGSPYAGKPRPGLDQAWHDLLKCEKGLAIISTLL
jgi:hypothetical protein